MLKPALPEYDVREWTTWPFPERLKRICQAWAVQGYGSPLSVYLLYAIKIAAWGFVWAWFCTFTPGNTLANIGDWWATRLAFEKLMIWTFVFEGLGMGCGSGPLTARYVPPLGGFLYWLRPGTTKLPFFPGLPLVGGTRRTVLDVVLYAATVGLAFHALTSAEIAPWQLVAMVCLAGIMGLGDKTLFLAFRSEHYVSSMVVLLFADDWIAGQKWVWLAIWWWAATSKVTHHFPAVMCVMNSNAPWTRFGPLRQMMYRDYPNDLRPARSAVWLAHFGTVGEYAYPSLLLLGDGGAVTALGLFMITGFHLFIASNVPMGVPLEWNFVMIYGAWVLFGVHVDVSMWSIGSPLLVAWLVGFHLAMPLYVSMFPGHGSFLIAMRYYAGNWAYSVWLFRDGADEKLDQKLVKWSPLPRKQLSMLYDDDTVTALLSKVMAFRAMHLHGRMLPRLLPRVVDDIDHYEWYDGELIAGLALGWNFGDGHLHNEQLLDAIQQQVGFQPGEVRCLFVESQPLFKKTLSYRIVDAATGLVEAGEVPVIELVDAHPWPVEA